MIIRKAAIEDLDNLVPLFNQYRMFYGKPSDQPAAKQFLKERMERGESEIFISLDNGGNMTGFVQLYPLFSSTRMKRLWLLNDLFVHPDYRGKGFSIALIEEAKKLCLQPRSCGMMLETAKSNLIGNKLYPKAGFALDTEHNYYTWDA